VAVVSKILGAALATWKEEWKVRIQTGVCMVARGEVGIIVALVGISLHTITQELYSLVLGMSLLTTIVAPPLIVWAFRHDR